MGHPARMGEINAKRRETPLGIPNRRREYDIKMNLSVTVYEGVD